MLRFRTVPRFCLYTIIFMVFTTACSTTFFYRHMDWLLIRFVEGFVKLDDSQKQHVRSDLTRLSAELEDSVLPDLEVLLDRIAEDNRQGVMGANLDEYMLQAETLYKRTAQLAEPGISVLALSLSSEQRKQLFQEYARRDDKFRRKYLAKGEAHAQQEHLRTLRKNIRKWIGRTGAEQDAALRTYTGDYQANERHWLESRQRWQAELREVLSVSDDDTKRARLTALLRKPQQVWTQEYRNVAEHNRSVSVALARKLTTKMDDRQRAKFARQLGKNQQKLDNFSQASSARPKETTDRRSFPSAAKVARQPEGLARKANSH